MFKKLLAVLRREKKAVVILLLAAVIFYAFVVRFLGIRFGLPYLHHWDEPQSASTALQMLKTGDLNPHFFGYPGFPIYSCLLIDILHYYYLMGRKVSDGYSLRHLDEIVIKQDTGWPWTLSHPSFYLWNRVWIVLLGTLSVLLLYLIASEIYGKKAGILAALLLSGSAFHIEHSRFITPDMPSSFFVLLVVLFALRFHYFRRTKDLALSLVFVGFAISCKYNLVLCLVVPVAAYALNWTSLRRPARLLLLGLILVLPWIVFLIMNPFLLADFKTFLMDTGSQVQIYRAPGDGGAKSPAVIPAGDQFIMQMESIKKNISGLIFFLAGLGVFVLLRRPKLLLLLLIFPALHTYVLTQQVLTFHRNYLVLYPLFALFSALAVVFLSTRLSQLSLFLEKKYLPRGPSIKGILSLTPFFILLPVLFLQEIHHFRRAYRLWTTRETRTQAVAYLNELAGKKDKADMLIGIASELRIHRLDLKDLKTDYQIFDHKDLKRALQECDYLLVGEYESYDPQWRDEDRRLNRLTPANLVTRAIGKRATRRDIFSMNPKVIVLKSPQRPGLRIRPSVLEGKKVDMEDGSILVPWGGRLKAQSLKYEAGRYSLQIVSRGNEVLGQTALFKVYFGERLIGEYFAATEYQDETIEFEIKGDVVASVIIEYANDYRDEERQLDRNAWIRSITITRLE